MLIVRSQFILGLGDRDGYDGEIALAALVPWWRNRASGATCLNVETDTGSDDPARNDRREAIRELPDGRGASRDSFVLAVAMG